LAAAISLVLLAGGPAFGQCPPPPVPFCNPYEDNNGPLLKGDPCLDSPCWAPPGWFFGVELDVVGSHVKNRLVGQIGDDTVHVPSADLDWTVSPRFELGYRFAAGWGELLLTYKFLATSGTQTQSGFDGDDQLAVLHSRLNINAWDLDYATREYSLWPCCDMRWRAGVRLAGVFFDSVENNSFSEQRESNYFFGAGPHVGLDVRRFVMGTGVQLIGRVETAFLIGETHQSFEEELTIPGVASIGAANRQSQTEVVPWLNIQAGVGWTPPDFDRLTVSAGYTYEVWWDMADVGNSRASITAQGIFFRAEVRY
jgi:hypothetical protein